MEIFEDKIIDENICKSGGDMLMVGCYRTLKQDYCYGETMEGKLYFSKIIPLGKGMFNIVRIWI